MTKYELSISTNWVPDWGVTEAFRELFQNAYDQEIVNPDAKMTWHRYGDVIRISNDNTLLPVDSLLIGNSTKQTDENTIGEHGEGYKTAFMVLLRHGKKIKVFNRAAKETWEVRLVNSKKYNGNKIVTVFVDKKAFWEARESNELTIEVSGITEDEYSDIVAYNLNLQDIDPDEVKNARDCRILLNPDFAGNIYVKGLFVTHRDDFEYGYDFVPRVIRLDRDRKMASEFDIKWEASKAWNELSSNDSSTCSKAVALVKKGAHEVSYVDSFNNIRSESLVDSVANDFYDEHGDSAVAVTSNKEYEQYKEAGYKPVIVTEKVKSIINKSSVYIAPEIEADENSADSLVERFRDFAESVKSKLSGSEYEQLVSLIDEVSDVLEE